MTNVAGQNRLTAAVKIEADGGDDRYAPTGAFPAASARRANLYQKIITPAVYFRKIEKG
ncbi:MAG TPA: hypothetical protein VGM07_21395 [Stellaceae bacterium]